MYQVYNQYFLTLQAANNLLLIIAMLTRNKSSGTIFRSHEWRIEKLENLPALSE